MQISTEYYRGILFIRMKGRLEDNDLAKINNIINEFGIKYVVLNLSSLKDVSLESIDHIIKYNKEILKKKKYLLICDSNQRRNRLFKNIIPYINNELEAFSLI
mgnify:CR=1 FL=1